MLKILHKPLKDLDIAVDTDVDIVHTGGFCQVFFEVLHVGDEELFLTGEILVDLAILVKNVNHDHLLLLTAPTGFLETVMNPARSTDAGRAWVPPADVVGGGWPTGGPHPSACLLLL